jgi:hypothetical protein
VSLVSCLRHLDRRVPLFFTAVENCGIVIGFAARRAATAVNPVTMLLVLNVAFRRKPVRLDRPLSWCIPPY